MGKNQSRRAARIRAFQVLYSLQFTPVNSLAELKDISDSLPADSESTLTFDADFAWDLIRGAWTGKNDLDASIAEYSHNWRIDRLGKVERTILRLAFYELEHRPDVPGKVIISEALELTSRFANVQARHFINGILDSAARKRESESGKSSFQAPSA